MILVLECIGSDAVFGLDHGAELFRVVAIVIIMLVLEGNASILEVLHAITATVVPGDLHFGEGLIDAATGLRLGLVGSLGLGA